MTPHISPSTITFLMDIRLLTSATSGRSFHLDWRDNQKVSFCAVPHHPVFAHGLVALLGMGGHSYNDGTTLGEHYTMLLVSQSTRHSC